MGTIPTLGLGTWQMTGDTCTQAVLHALEIGYRHIDTADVYGNHVAVGKGLAESGMKREEYFLTSKVWRDFLHRDQVQDSAQRFLEELQVPYIDLLLIHWPNTDVEIGETLEAFAALKEKGLIRMIGVSNFTTNLLESALATGVEIATNQVEFHPSLNQKQLKNYCDERGVIITAYSPIAQGADLSIPLIAQLAEKYEKTPSQVILNWLAAKDMVIIPRSSNPARIAENFAALDFELEPSDIEQIEGLDMHNRIVRPDFAPFDD